jgi:hypothetical protein
MTLQRLLEEIAMTSCMIFFGVVLIHATRQKKAPGGPAGVLVVD